MGEATPATAGSAADRLSGLTSDEARRRLERDGRNVVVPERTGAKLRRYVGPLADPMVLLLLVAAPTYALIGETSDAIVALVALVPVIAVGWVLEARAERTLERLRQLTAATTLVRRDGLDVTVPIEEVVVGDLVTVHEGDVVPADGAMVDGTQVSIDESALTGESLTVAKVSGDPLRAGTVVASGRAVMVVERIGSATEYGRIGMLLARSRAVLTPLQRALRRLVLVFSVVAAVACTAVVVSMRLRSERWGDAVIAGVSLAIAAIPEEFSMVYALYLALGAWRLSQQHALVRRLPSVETLGSTTVICTDKTGTLTEGRLDVGAVWAVAGDERRLLMAAVLACEPEPFDPLDRAVLRYAGDRGVDVTTVHAGTLVTDWPFDAVDKYLTHVWRSGDGCQVVAKGSLEGVLAHSRLDAVRRDDVRRAHDELAGRGMRVIAVASGIADAASDDRVRDESVLGFVGLIAFADPIRSGVDSALAECRAAGIRVVMITGDHPVTAHAVAEGLSLPHDVGGEDVIATGAQLDAADDAALAALVRDANVFARVRPEQKHLLVETLRRDGEVVAMTGDGINDAPALQAADIGVAMGVRGTAVARESAAMVLTDDNFSTIVAAVADGRRIVDNLARAIAYLVAFHPPLVFTAFVVPMLGKPLILLPIHLVLLEIVLHPVVSLVFQAQPPADDVMSRAPRAPGSALSTRALVRPWVLGSGIALVMLVEHLVALRAGWSAEQARMLAFGTLLAAQPFLVLSNVSPDRPWWRLGRPTRTLIAVLSALVVTMVVAVAVPPARDLLQLEPVPAWAWPVMIAAALLSTCWQEPLKRRVRR